MLFRFEPSDIAFKKVKIKHISKSFGGTLTVVDEERSTPVHEVYKRYHIPHSLERVFKSTYKISKFMVPMEGCIMMYKGNVIAIEKNQFNERYYKDSNGEIHEWLPLMESSFHKVKMLTYSGNWYFDGSYIYSFRDHQNDVEAAVRNGADLTQNSSFKAVPVDAIRVTYMGFTNEIYMEGRQCLAYIASNGAYAVSPPVWKAMSGLGNTNLKRSNDDNDIIGLTLQFDKVDAIMAVNLNFALTAGNILTKQFGYKSIEPLQLPKLMVQLKTVNLPKISQEIKQTFDIGMTFTQTIAWLLGLQSHITEYDQMLAIRKLFKYLSIKGIFLKKSLMDIHHTTGVEIPLLTIEQAKENAQKLKSFTPSEKLQQILEGVAM